MAARRIAGCLTGDPRDLGFRSGIAGLLLHLRSHAGSLQKRKLVENLIFNWKVTGTRIRARLATLDYRVPHFLVISPTMRCNLKCKGCYSALYSKDGELSEGKMDRLLGECRKLGSGHRRSVH